MQTYYHKSVILLLDEYDVPLAKASSHEYYTEMLSLIKTLLSTALKDNPNLCFAVITGCLKIAKESIFTGTNNFVSNTISHSRLNEYFGFTENDVNTFLKKAHAEIHASEDNLWSILYPTGYLTRANTSQLSSPETDGVYALKIPNAEIREIFETTVIKWFDDSARTWNKQVLFQAVWNTDCSRITDEMTRFSAMALLFQETLSG